MIQINDFIGALEEEFEDVAAGSISPDTKFRELEGWSSMMALIIIARIDSDYNVTISAEELATTHTVQDLFALIQQKV